MTSPSWLVAVLEACESRSLDSPKDRQAVADAIMEAFPREALANGIGGAIARVLKQRGIRDGGQEIAAEIAGHASHVASFILGLTPEQVTKATK